MQSSSAAADQRAAPTTGDRSAWWMLAVLFVFYTIAYIDRLAVTMMVEPIKADLHLSDTEISIIIGPAFSLFYAVFGIPLGAAADRLSRRWVIYLGMTAWSCATMAGAFADSFASVLTARVFAAVGEAALVPAAYSLLSDRFEKRRLTTAMAIFSSGQKAGMAATFTLVGLAMALAANLSASRLAHFASWQAAFLLIGAPGLVLALLAFTFAEPERRNATHSRPLLGRELISFLKTEYRLSAPLAFAIAVMSIAIAALSGWSPTFLERHYGWQPVQYGPLLSLISLASAGTVVALGWLMDRLRARGVQDAHLRLYSWLLAVGLPLSLFGFLLPSAWPFFVVLAVLQTIVMPFMVYFIATLHLITPETLRGQVTGFYFGLAALAGWGIGPLMVGALNDVVFHDPAKIGWSLTLVLPACLLATLITLRLILPRLRRAIEAQGAAENSAP